MRSYLLILLITLTIPTFCQNYNAEIINYNTYISFNGRSVKENIEYEIQINNAAGTNYAEIQIPYRVDNPPKNLKAGIYDIFGDEIRQLKKKQIETKTPWSNIEFHSDDRMLCFKLIHTSYPYILKYSYSTSINTFITLAWWNPDKNNKIKTHNATLSIEIPIQSSINIYQQHIDSATIIENEDSKLYQWELHDYVAPQKESYSLDMNELIPNVRVMPETFHYGIDGSGHSWKDYGNWNYQLIEDLDRLTTEEKIKVHQLTDSLSNDIEKIKTLYHYLQDNTRYICITLENGGLIPYPATYVCTNRYGDCKALSNYMKALLKEINIESCYSTIYSGIKPIKVKDQFPSPQANHAILCVPLKKDTIWLECTDKTAPFNYLGSHTQDRKALLYKKNSSDFANTPKHSLNDALQLYKTSISISENQDATFESTGILKGRAFDYLKSFDTDLSENEKQQYIDYITFSSMADISDFSIHRPHRDSSFLNLNLKGKVNRLSQKLGSKTLLKPFKSLTFDMETPKKRKNELFMYYPINRCDTFIYSFNHTISKVDGLANIKLKSEFGSYQKEYSIKDHKLTIVRNLQLKQGRYPFEQYAHFYEFIEKVNAQENQKIIITH